MIFGEDETIETTAVSVNNLGTIISPSVIRCEHKAIGADMVQRIQMMLDRQPQIKAYSVSEDWSKKAVESMVLCLDGAKLEVTLRSE